MDWMALITMIFDFILQMIEKCQEDDTEEVVFARLRKPGFREVHAARTVIREHTDLRGKELKEMADLAISDLAAASDDEIRSLMKSAREKDNQ